MPAPRSHYSGEGLPCAEDRKEIFPPLNTALFSSHQVQRLPEQQVVSQTALKHCDSFCVLRDTFQMELFTPRKLALGWQFKMPMFIEFPHLKSLPFVSLPLCRFPGTSQPHYVPIPACSHSALVPTPLSPGPWCPFTCGMPHHLHFPRV